MSGEAQTLRMVARGQSPIMGERVLVHWTFEGGGFVQMTCGGNVSTEAALDMAEEILRLKREELARRAEKPAPAGITEGEAP